MSCGGLLLCLGGLSLIGAALAMALRVSTGLHKGTALQKLALFWSACWGTVKLNADLK